MITIIYGAKGTGKTKTILAKCNDDARTSSGTVVFLTDTSKYSTQLDLSVRMIDVTQYHVTGKLTLESFIEGMIAANHDIKSVYIDGAQRITREDLACMSDFYSQLEFMSIDNDVNFTLTVSAPLEDLPDFMKKYI